MIKHFFLWVMLIYFSTMQIKAQNNIFPVHLPNNGKWGYIDLKGNTAIPFEYEAAGEFSEGLAGIKQNGKCGYIDVKGKIRIPLLYDATNPFSEGLAAVVLDSKYGFINKKGQMMIKPAFEYAEAFKNGQTYVYSDKKSLYINKKGEFISNPITNFDEFVDGLAVREKNGKCGYINVSGEFVIEPLFYKAYRFYQGRANVQFNEKKYGFIDTKGNILFETDFVPFSKFNEGLACVYIDGKLGFIDTTGKLVINNIYSNEIPEPVFSDGLCRISLNNSTVVIDKAGKIITEIESSQSISDFHEGFAVISNVSGKCAYMNKKGEIITDFKYEDAHQFSEGLAVAVTDNSEFEIIDTKGKIIVKLPDAYTSVGTDFKFKYGICILHTSISPDSNMVVPTNTENPDYIKQWGGVVDIWVDRTGKVIWKGAPWYSCFPPTALVSLVDGSQKEIQEIKRDDLVLSYQIEENKFIGTTVTEVKQYTGKYELSHINFSTEKQLTASLNWNDKRNHFIEATPMHPIITEKGIKNVKDLQMGDLLFYKDSKSKMIEKVQVNQILHHQSTSNTVYSLKTVSGNYIVNGIVVLMK